MLKRPISTCLWYNGKAEEAAGFYCTYLRDAKITAQSPIVTEFEYAGQKIICLNGGPQIKPNPSISFYVLCENAAEAEDLWEAFKKDGKILMPLDCYPWCEKYGWLQDQYGVSWQILVNPTAETDQKLKPCLLFTGNQYGRAEEAMELYSSIFKNARIDYLQRYGANEAPNREGTLAQAQLSLNGQKFIFMESNREHEFKFDDGVSFTVYCDTQEEIDYFWEKLTEGGQESMCGWLRDRFGVSWQIIPSMLGELMSDPSKAGKAVEAFMEMRKFDIEKLISATL